MLFRNLSRRSSDRHWFSLEYREASTRVLAGIHARIAVAILNRNASRHILRLAWATVSYIASAGKQPGPMISAEVWASNEAYAGAAANANRFYEDR